MDNKKRKSSISIGSTMLVLIFGIVTLSTFAILAVVSAKADQKLVSKNEEIVSAYYMADGKGEELLYQVDKNLAEFYSHADSEIRYYEMIYEEYGEAFSREDHTLVFFEELNDQLRLHMTLEVEYHSAQGANYKILTWNTENYGEHQIDDSMSVWEGEN